MADVSAPNLFCVYEGLSNAQIEFYGKRKKEFEDFKLKFDTLIGNRSDVSVEKGESCSFLEFYSASGFSPSQMAPNGRLVQGSQPSPFIVVNSRLGLLTTQGSNVGPTSILVSGISTNSNNTLTLSNGALTNTTARNLTSGSKTPVLIPSVDQLNNLSTAGKIMVRKKRTFEGPTDSGETSKLPRIDKPMFSLTPPIQQLPQAPPQPPPPPPPAPISTISIDLTDDSINPSDNSNTSTSSGKTYPSLVVIARPCIRGDKDHRNPTYVQEKKSLDQRMKQVLLLTRDKFTEWLIQIGLLRCDLLCSVHRTVDGSRVKLKLGMFTDSAKFPFSGGYVWVSDCCPQHCISVFAGSIFETSSYPPSTTIKLIYHWACQTSIQNIMQWIEVSNVYIKNLFTNLRAVCTAAVHEHFEKMGGPGKHVQVGVVSLGSSLKTDSSKQIRIEILSIYDPETKYVRLRAVDPVNEYEKTHFSYRRFSKIFEIMCSWVDRSSTLLVDNTIDKSALINMGFKNVTSVQVKDRFGKEQYPNFQIMDYLRQIIPKMFKNTLGVLSKVVIQQFLDELVWREKFGYYPAKAFDSITKHLIEQTKLDTGAPLRNRLYKISYSPFKDWKYDNWSANCATKVSLGPSVQNKAIVPLSTTSKLVSAGPSQMQFTPKIPISPIISQVPTQQVVVSSPSGLPQIVNVPTSFPMKKLVSSTAPSPSSSLTPPPPPPPPPLLKTPSLGEANSSGGNILLVTHSGQKNSEMVLANLQVAKILLEPYYYGTIRGNKRVQNRVMKINFQCFSCNKEFSSPLEMTDHLIKHALNKSLTAGDLKELCKICLKIFPSLYFLQKHHVQVHSDDSQNEFTCQICHMKFKDQSSVVSHMTRTHLELELPYSCQVCSFKTSIYMNMIDHISDCHGRDDVGFCPYCFKVVNYLRNGKLSLKNQYNFIYHIQRHQLPRSKKCAKCVIRCLNRTVLCEHEIDDHRSHNRSEEVERFTGEKTTLMPAPLSDPPEPKEERYKMVVGGPYKIVASSNPPIIDKEDQQYACIECDAKLSNNHFMSELLCMKCDYSTFCVRAMNEHHTTSHLSNNACIYRLDRNVPTIYESNLTCDCSFVTKDGNLMALHLVCCKKETAYIEFPKKDDTDPAEDQVDSTQSPENEQNITSTLDPPDSDLT